MFPNRKSQWCTTAFETATFGSKVELPFGKNSFKNYNFSRLSTRRPLDRESKSHYTLIILASEDCVNIPKYQEASDAVSALRVHVTVTDVNDNAPKFLSKIFTGGITTEADFGIDFMQIKVSKLFLTILIATFNSLCM